MMRNLGCGGRRGFGSVSREVSRGVGDGQQEGVSDTGPAGVRGQESQCRSMFVLDKQPPPPTPSRPPEPIGYVKNHLTNTR